MVSLSRDDVLKLANLAYLELSEDEIEQYQKEINTILQYVEQLQTAETKVLEPTNQVTGLSDVTRPDEIIDYHLDRKILFQNIPETEDGLIKVKRVLE